MKYIEIFASTPRACMFNAIQQCVTVHRKRLDVLMEGPDVLWQERMVYAIGQLGYDVELINFTEMNGKSGMNGFAFMDAHRDGKYIIYMHDHVAAVIDSKLFDVRDTRFNTIYWAWKLIGK